MLTTAHANTTKGYINHPAGKIHYWTVGSGHPLLLIHQSSSSGEEYARLIPYLEHDFQLISFDWPGHGNSDDPKKEPDVEAYTTAAMAVLEHLQINKCHILGHHGGALLAMNIAYLHPERVGKLMLSGTSGPKTKEESEAFKDSLPAKKLHIIPRDGSTLHDAWLRYTNYLAHSEPKEILSPYLSNIMSRMRPYDAHYAVLGWDRKPALKSLKMPVLFIQGTEDVFVSRQEQLLEIVPNSKRTVIQGAGPFHYVGMPKESAAAIKAFLMND